MLDMYCFPMVLFIIELVCWSSWMYCLGLIRWVGVDSVSLVILCSGDRLLRI